MAISNSASGFRYCPSCQTEKQLTEYTIRKSGYRTGQPTPYCKECSKNKTAQYRANNRERYLQLKKESRIKREANTKKEYVCTNWDNLSLDEKEKLSCGVYCITIGPKFYIGSTVNFNKRMKDHTRKLGYGTHINKYMQSAFNKYQTFDAEVIYRCSPSEVAEAEQKFIDIWFNHNDCLNLRPDVATLFGFKHSEKTKSLISDKLSKKFAEVRNGNQ